MNWLDLEKDMFEIAYSCLGVGILIGIGIGFVIYNIIDRK